MPKSPKDKDAVDIRECMDCKNLYDATRRKYAHSCPYCTGDAGPNKIDKPDHERGWK